jgi:hypothetical protein
MLAVNLCLCKYPNLVYASRHCLKPGRTCDHISQLSAQLGALQKGLSYTQLVVFLTFSNLKIVIQLLTFSQIIIVRNILYIINMLTYTMYVLDNVLERPIYV